MNLNELENRMKGAIEHLKQEFSGLRTGRASAGLLDNVKVSVYGSDMPLNQLASVSTPDAQTIGVSVWDAGNTTAVEKAIRDSELGLNPSSNGSLIRIPVPPLTEERRFELKKVANGYAEDSRIAVRNVRRDGIEQLRSAEKAKEISKDEMEDGSVEIQTLTDKYIKNIDAMMVAKDEDIMTV